MLEQQFLTTFNTFLSSSSASSTKKSSLIVDFINGTYQGFLSHTSQPDGLGTVVDDEFNFIVCSNWSNGKIDGYVYVKLASQISMWGLWEKGTPKKVVSIKVGLYVIHIPYGDYSRLRRPRKCIVCHSGKGKMYLTTIQRYPEGTKSNREYSIIIQKVLFAHEKPFTQACSMIDISVQPYEHSQQQFLEYMESSLHCIKITQKHNGIFITANLHDSANKRGVCLGLLVDNGTNNQGASKRRFMTKSVGLFARRSGKYNSNNIEAFQQDQNYQILLNGLGLSKMDDQPIIGIFRDDMLIRQLNAQENIESIRNNSQNYGRNLNGSIVKQILGHEHMRSMSYQHNYLYFPQIKKIISMAVQLHKYIQMFERLSHQKQPSNFQTLGEHPVRKYENQFDNRFINQLSPSQHSQSYERSLGKVNSSSGNASIIDQYPEFKVNVDLSKGLYRDRIQDGNNRKIQGNWVNKSPNQQQNKGHIVIEEEDLDASNKKPGFIRKTRTSAHFAQKIERFISDSPGPGLNKRMSPSRCPNKTQTKWRI